MWDEKKNNPEIYAAVLAKKALLDAETVVKPEDSNAADDMDDNAELPDDGNDTSGNVPSQGKTGSGDLSSTEMQRYAVFSFDTQMTHQTPTSRNIKVLGPLVVRLLKELSRKTGWAFTMLMGGLNQQGLRETYKCILTRFLRCDLTASLSVNIGATYGTKLNWSEYVGTEFEDRIMSSFNEFLTCVYRAYNR